MRIPTWLVLGFIVSNQPLHANGGGYFRGGVEKAGDVAGFEPKETDKIRILDEKLTVALGSQSADVEVRYLMRNETDKKVRVRFGFPVEESFDENDFGGPTESERPEKLYYCKNYIITASGKSVVAKWQVEEKAVADKRFKGIVGWLVSEITFAAGEEKPVMIHFQSGYPLKEWSVSDDTSIGASLFKYRLSSAACWAGSIGTGRITLKPAGIDPRELKVLKPVNRFQKDGENWVWSFEDLEPSLADDIEVEASPTVDAYPVQYGGPDASRYVNRGGRWTMVHTNYRVTASSTLPPGDGLSYEAANLKSGGADSVWSEGAEGSGIGEWLEIVPQVPKPLTAISIFPGYRKSDELFKANARPKRILVELDGAHRFHVDVPDSAEEFRIPVTSYTKPVKTIRLTFEDVWKGTRFEDFCVSGVRLHVKLDKKPQIQPAR